MSCSQGNELNAHTHIADTKAQVVKRESYHSINYAEVQEYFLFTVVTLDREPPIVRLTGSVCVTQFPSGQPLIGASCSFIEAQAAWAKRI